jgi:hypothetical protein
MIMKDFDLLLPYNNGRKSYLDKEYYNHINNLTKTLNEDDECRWETYGIIFQQLLNDGNFEAINEFKYRFTDGENPNEVLLDIINRHSNSVNNLTWFLKCRIEEYLDDDLVKRFLS